MRTEPLPQAVAAAAASSTCGPTGHPASLAEGAEGCRALVVEAPWGTYAVATHRGPRRAGLASLASGQRWEGSLNRAHVA